ncbi:serine hydrolase, partial [Lutibacter sp.]|uniref:serine hydrolase n=1 Tax=Lutibacter sp. TaxID=1925666 RepID=UPI003569914F
MKHFSVFFVVALFATTTLFSQNELPIHSENSKLKPLGTLLNKDLQKDLELQLNTIPKWKTLIQQNKLAVGVIDLSDPNEIKYARINGGNMMYAASLPKIAILLAAMDAIEKGELKETPEVTNDMKIMISRSSNSAATRMIDRLGFDKIESVLTDEKYNLYDEEHGGGLWVGKRYASGGATNREPLKNLSHAATVNQVCRFYYLLANGELVNSKRSKQMLGIMEKPALHHKFVNTLDQIAPNARLFRKSGSWKNFHS